ncbi:GntR family transcriptional regulator [Nonomuraea muscovyensis]|uniref:DNA-binding GntR family transcriptional regulator n=1 Tax=Nonomuraea muscovyensis TaxID=1124761 RepID=A0A7X0EZX9_9ACTN|nr:GntR family transcriptional regulator [Nonomuraea muscovyensis]MBB6347989.1 DNA-binding GntR family transcriptional regulator [Nonomuraea muscovyensis]
MTSSRTSRAAGSRAEPAAAPATANAPGGTFGASAVGAGAFGAGVGGAGAFGPEARGIGRREHLRDRIRDALRAAIISGRLEPGVIYSAPTLGAQFGVSSTPVREAMLDLVKEGLVVPHPNKGFRITEVSEQDLDNLAAVRLLIEPPTVRDAVAVIPADDFPRLRTLAQDIVEAVERADLVGYIEADHVFHLTLLGYSGNRFLVDVVSGLRTQTRLPGLVPLLESGRLGRSAAEHHELLDLVEARDPAGAELLMRRHIGHVRGLWAGGPEPAPTGPAPA